MGIYAFLKVSSYEDTVNLNTYSISYQTTVYSAILLNCEEHRCEGIKIRNCKFVWMEYEHEHITEFLLQKYEKQMLVIWAPITDQNAWIHSPFDRNMLVIKPFWQKNAFNYSLVNRESKWMLDNHNFS